MGLDMYLTARRYLSDYEEQERKISEAIAKLELGNMNFRIKEVSCDVGYWRKANAIHKWFVHNVQGGIDNCKPYHVSKKDLEKLLEVCNFVTKNKKDVAAIMEKLPPQSGFFFGGTEVDEYYFEDIKETKKIIKAALKLDDSEWSLYYQSSW